MPSIVEITTTTTTVALDAQRKGQAVFDVVNPNERNLRAIAWIKAPNPVALDWIKVAGPKARPFGIKEKQQYTVEVAVPPTAPAATYQFQLVLGEEALPDTNFTEGPTVTLEVKPAVVPP